MYVYVCKRSRCQTNSCFSATHTYINTYIPTLLSNPHSILTHCFKKIHAYIHTDIHTDIHTYILHPLHGQNIHIGTAVTSVLLQVASAPPLLPEVSLSPDVGSALPLVLDNLSRPAFDVKECPVCFSEVDSSFVILACRHVFCTECVTEIKRTHPVCPLCRAPMAAPNVVGLSVVSDASAAAAADCGAFPDWNVAAVRRIRQVEFAADGNVMVDDGRGGKENTNIFVRPGARIVINPGSRIVVNGREVENPQQCQQQ
jgi:hypothetical protein